MDIPTSAVCGRQGWLSFLLQTCDSIFPTGAYAHSLGLEEIVRLGIVSDEKSLLTFLQNHIISSVIHIDLPLVREARLAAIAENLADILEIDRMAGALKMARELRETSLRIGRQRLSIMARIHATPMLELFHQIALINRSRGHHTTVWGIACVHVENAAALSAYFYQSISSYCIAAPKLIRIGQEGAQRVLTNCLAETQKSVAQSEKVSRRRIGWFDPLIEMASMRHEIANERIFIS